MSAIYEHDHIVITDEWTKVHNFVYFKQPISWANAWVLVGCAHATWGRFCNELLEFIDGYFIGYIWYDVTCLP